MLLDKLMFWRKKQPQQPQQLREVRCVYSAIYPNLHEIYPGIFPNTCWHCDGYGKIDNNPNLCNDYFSDSESARTALIELAENERNYEDSLLEIIKNHARDHARALSPEDMARIDEIVSIFLTHRVTNPARAISYCKYYTQQKIVCKKELRKTTTVLMKLEKPEKPGKN
jgi:hypothetical protein